MQKITDIETDFFLWNLVIHHILKFIIMRGSRLQFIIYIFFREGTEAVVAVPSLYTLSVFLIIHKIFSRSTGPPAERETRPVLLDIPPIKSRQQQYLKRVGATEKIFYDNPKILQKHFIERTRGSCIHQLFLGYSYIHSF